MTHIIGAEKPPLDEIVHFGVRGMHWGVRKQKELDKLNRIASGHAKFSESVGFSLSLPLHKVLASSAGKRRIAAGRAAILQAQKDRIQSGNATTSDRLDRALNTSILDLARGR